MQNMQFLPELRKFLKEKGIIYTVRGYDMSYKEVQVEGVGTCIRKPLGLAEDLSKYVELSGFKTVEEWRKKINMFIPRGKKAWLYEVRKKEVK